MQILKDPSLTDYMRAIFVSFGPNFWENSRVLEMHKNGNSGVLEMQPKYDGP